MQQEATSRHRSRSPGQRRSSSSRGRHHSGRRRDCGDKQAGQAVEPALLQPSRPLLAPTTAEADPIAAFFAGAKNQLPTTKAFDCMAAELEAHVAAAVAVPLEFNGQAGGPETLELGPPDAFGPTLAGPMEAMGHFSCQVPARSAVVELQLGAVTMQVRYL